MKRVFPQESVADSHSLLSNGFQPGALGGSRRVQTSAAMLGIALSFGTSAPLLIEPESALAAEGPVVAVLPAAGSATDFVRPVFVTHRVGPTTTTTYHTVEEGDSLWHIAAEHKADVNSIKSANGIYPDEVLHVGQVLRVPSVIESEAVAELSGKVHRLALNQNVRGSVGGDLSVVFGENLPLASTLQDASEDGAVAKLDVGSEATEDYELRAAALLEDESRTLPQVDVASGTPVVAALPADLPVSMPLNEVTVNPLDDLTAAIAPAIPLEPAEDVSSSAPRAAVETPVESVAESGAASSVNDLTATEPAADANGWQDQAVQPEPEPATDLATQKPLTVAALGNAPASAEADLDLSIPVSDTRVYRVKAGDTLWNIASRHGLSVADLRRHNAGIQRPESLAVGSSLSIPVGVEASSPEASDTTLARAGQLSTDSTREAAIQDHLARIREAANREIDQDVLKARIIAVRQSLETAEANMGGSEPLEYHGVSDVQPAAALVRPTTAPIGRGVEATQPVLTQSARVNQAQWTVTDAATETDATKIAALAAPVSSEGDVVETSVVSPVPEDLLAVAPMSPDVYRASPQLPIGEVVTPGMPILPESGEFLPEAPNRFNGYVWPAQGTLTSGYGWRWGRMHRGIDIAGPVGTPIMAAAPGVVVRSGWNSGGYGNLVDIRHADGSLTRYAHNSRLLVREGQEVRQGQQIAEMGSTGYSTGPHLHFEVHLPNAGTVNPLAHLPGR